MKKIGFILAVIAVLCFATNASAEGNMNGKWALHYAGIHNTKANTCTTSVVTACGDIVTAGPSASSNYYDVYVIAADVDSIAGTRYGLVCDGTVYFNSWTKCTDFEIPTGGWPGCGEDNAQTWTSQKYGPYLTLGILEIYIYSGTNGLSTAIDSRVGFSEWCDGTQPAPICVQMDGSDSRYYGSIGFNGGAGFSPCGIVPTQNTSWGRLKALYR